VPVQIRLPSNGIILPSRPNQGIAQKFGVARLQPQTGNQDFGFMSASRVVWIEAKVAEFGDIYGGLIAGGQFHQHRACHIVSPGRCG